MGLDRVLESVGSLDRYDLAILAWRDIGVHMTRERIMEGEAMIRAWEQERAERWRHHDIVHPPKPPGMD